MMIIMMVMVISGSNEHVFRNYRPPKDKIG